MCVNFSCESCWQSFVNRCENVAFDAKEGDCGEISNSKEPLRCESCIIVEGAIQNLNALLYQAPFLESEGLAGIEKVASWERDEYHKLLFKQKGQKGWKDKAESRAERHEVAEKLKNMGLDGIADDRAAHQGFDMALTPKNSQADKENNMPHKRRESDLTGW